MKAVILAHDATENIVAPAIAVEKTDLFIVTPMTAWVIDTITSRLQHSEH